jgi:hypothetical protein
MDFHGPEFVLAIIAMSTIGWMFTSWVRARHGYPVAGEWGEQVTKTDPQAERKLQLLSSENEALHGKISRLEERIAVLERIATDGPTRLSQEIENLHGA